MFSVNTNVGALAALQSLNATEQALQTTQNQVSTGKKVSSASDNPAIYAISQTMNDNIAGLSAVSDNLNFGQSVIGVAQSAASQISGQLATLTSTIMQGQQSGIDSTTINNQIKSILNNIDQFAQSATFNGVNLLSMTGAGVTSTNLNVTENLAGSLIAVGNQDATSTGLNLANLKVNSGAVKISFDNTFAPANSDDIKLTAGSNTYDFVLSDGSSTQTTTTNPSAADQTFFVNIGASDSNTTVLSKVASAMQQQGFGAGLDSNGNLVVTGNGVTSSTSTIVSGGATDGTVTGSTAAVDIVNNAVTLLNTKIAALGAASQQITGMQSFTSSLSTSLTTGLGALTAADMAAESAKLQSLQTKQQLGIQSLSIANQQPQALMSLFR
jgi:flagellin